MNEKNKEREILYRAIEMLRKNTELTIEIEPYPVQADYRPDAVLRVVWQDLEYFFEAEIKKVITPAALGGVIRQLNLFRKRGILVARYITPRIADQLKKMDIPFMDAAGNAYMNEPPLFIFLKGNKPPDDYHIEPPIRTFRPAGLQVLFALLCYPGLENAPFREIAKKANVALGTVGWVMRDLKNLRYLIDMHQKKRRLIRKEDLLNRWVTAYPEQLRPRKLIGLYHIDNRDWWKNADTKGIDAFWGGEVAAARLTEYLKPQKITIYTKQPIAEFLLKNKIKKDPRGDIEILRVFWNFEVDWPHKDIVPPLLIYADLLATGDPRNIEIAEIIYEKELDRFIGKD